MLSVNAARGRGSYSWLTFTLCCFTTLCASAQPQANTPAPQYEPFVTTGGTYTHFSPLGVSGVGYSVTHAFDNPFSFLGCDHPSNGFAGVNTLTFVGAPVSAVQVKFENGSTFSVGNCTGKCQQASSSFVFKPAEVILDLTAVQFGTGGDGYGYNACGGVNWTSAVIGTNSNRTFGAAYSDVSKTGGNVGLSPVALNVGSGFLCGIYGFLTDKNYSAQVQASTEPILVPTNSIVQLGFAFLKQVQSSSVSNMTFPSLGIQSVQATPQYSLPGSNVNNLNVSETITVSQMTSHQFTKTWTTSAQVQNTFSTAVRPNFCTHVSSKHSLHSEHSQWVSLLKLF